MIQVRCLCDNRMFKTVAVSVLLISTVLGQNPLLSVSQNQVDLNSSLTVMCEIATNAEIRFLVDNNQVGSCPPDYVSQDCSPPEIHQNTTAGLTTWTLTATVAYEGSWTCEKSFVQSNTETINMYKCPNTIISESGINSDMVVSGTETVHISFKIGCIYPTSNPDIWLRFLPSNSSTAPYKSLNCRETADSCATGSVYRCNQDISYKMNVANGSLELGYNYTLYIDSVVLPSIGTCDRLALFEPYSLQFEEGGPVTTTEEPVTEQSTIASSIMSTETSHFSTIGSSKDSTDIIYITSTDQVSSSNASADTEPKNMLPHLVISVSVPSSCLVVISVVVLCVVNHKRHTKEQKTSDTFEDPNPSDKIDCVYLRNISNGQKGNIHAYGSRIISRTEYSHERSPNTNSHSRRNLPEQRAYFDNTIDSINNRREYREQDIEVVNLPHVHLKRTHGGLSRQPRQKDFSENYSLNHDQNSRGTMNHHGYYYSYPKYNLY